MKKQLLWMLVFNILLFSHLPAQDLFDLFDDEEEVAADIAINTFFSTRVINGQSVENPYPGDLIFVVSHHFGRLNQGFYDLFGLDQATIRLGLEYGVNDRLALAVGRSSYEKTYDAFLKYKILRQQTGLREVPVTLSWFSGAYLKSQKWPAGTDFTFGHRMTYVQQLLLARQFSRAISLQLTPAWVHRNLVPATDDPNDYFVLGMAGRWRITDWVALNIEYFHRLNEPVSFETNNTFSVGFDLDTGGHVFQLHFTNAQPMFEPGFLTGTRGSWLDGDVYFGFHITRTFALR
ncbi:MAG: DUF5777 family beta-barrel protein [Bacteroidales bacterium]|nr:DUF5777 family beta-barrel protein [Bacteroidales bacterium]